VLLWVASLLYSDVIGLTDHVLVDGGQLAFRLPFMGDEILRTAIATDDMRRLIRRVGFLGALGALAVVGWFAFPRRAAVGRLLACWPRGAQGVVAATLALAAALAYLPLGGSRGLAVYFAVALVGVSLVAIGLAPLAAPATSALERSARWVGAHGGWPVAGVSALALLAVAAAISTLAFGRTPHVVDGVAHLFQGRIFAQGSLYLPSHPLREFFDVDTIVNNGRWFSQYTPGHTFLLFLGEAARVPWLVNPLLGALSVLALHALGRELFDEATARLASLLVVLSPFVFLMSAEYYSHASALLFFTLTFLHYVRFVKRGGARNALLAGAFLGLCVLARPLSALACSVPLGVDLLLRTREVKKDGRLPAALGGAATVAVFCVLLLLYNRGTTGQWLAFGYGQAAGPGFGIGVVNPLPLAVDRLRLLNDALFAWPLPSLALVLVAFLGGRPTRWDYVLIAVPAALLLAHAPVEYRDTEFGPRYLYEATPAVVLLTARGVLRFQEALTRFVARPSPAGDVRLAAGPWVALLFATAAAFQWQPRIAYYASPEWKWAVHDDAARAARAAGLTNAIVFVSEPDVPEGDRWWESVFLENTLPLDEGDVIFARDLGARNDQLLQYSPSRRGYRARGDTLVALR
jgi:hypothetical protein